MPKSRHRAPTAGVRQWIVWLVAALLVAAAFAFFSPLGGGAVPVAWAFLLLLLCFATGSLASSMFLSRPLHRGEHLVLPAVREPQSIEPAPITTEPAAVTPTTARPRQLRTETPNFASSGEIGGSVGVTVLVTGGPAPEADEVAGLEEAPVVGIPEQKTATESETVAREEESGPYPGSVRPKPNGQSPDSGYRVKGNARSKRYHTMQSPYYERTKASVWFRSVADAERAGFSAWNSRTKTAI